MQKALLIAIAVLFFLPNLINKDMSPYPPYDQKENFDPSLSYLNSIEKLTIHIDNIAAAKKISNDSYEYVELVETIIKARFYHGFSHFTLSENFIAALSGKYIKEDYACKVQPEKILQQNNAACSQQALVMMAILRKKNITYRSVGFPHHYAMEVFTGNDWYFFDADMEPVITKQQRIISSWKHQNDSLKKYYDSSRFTDLDYKFGTGRIASAGVVNEVPARNARIFHSVTGILSKILWCFPLLVMILSPRLSAKWPFFNTHFQRRVRSFSISA